MLCPECGEKELVGRFCPACLAETENLTPPVPRPSGRVCPVCGRGDLIGKYCPSCLAETARPVIAGMRPELEFEPDEKSIIVACTVALYGSFQPQRAQFVTFGYEAGRLEQWDTAALCRPLVMTQADAQAIRRDMVEGASRDHVLGDLAVHLDDLMAIAVFQHQPLDDVALNRLEGVCRVLASEVFGRDLTPAERNDVLEPFRVGVEIALWRLWKREMARRGLPVTIQISDPETAGPDDHLYATPTPAEVDGCIIERCRVGYTVKSNGVSGAHHATTVYSLQETAYVSSVFRDGRPSEAPIQQHVDALARVGFARVVLAGGRELTLTR